MIQRIRQSLKDSDKGFTLVELLVVVIIIGILASVAIPVFLGQRQSAYDAAVQSDLKGFATAAETSFASNLSYPTDAQGFATNGAATPIKSADTEYQAFVDTSGTDAGYLIYGRHVESGQVFLVSSYDGGAPTKAGTSTAAAGSWTQAIPTAGTDGGSPATATFGTVITW